jgi:hypothetical protein
VKRTPSDPRIPRTQAGRPALARALGIAVGVTVLLGLLVAWFAWPAKALEPRDLPIVVAGPAPATAALAQRLQTVTSAGTAGRSASSVRPGAFAVTTVTDPAAADQLLRDRQAYAAFVLGPTGVALHTASGASPTVAALLGQAAQQLGAGTAVTVVDVVPGAAADPRGAGFASGYLPLVLASLIAGVLLAVAIPGPAARLVGLGAFAGLAGLLGAAVLHGLGLLGGGYLAAAGSLALLSLAVSGTVAGLAAVLGAPGIGLGVLVVFLFGNPISAVAAAPELLPQPWGAIGQWLPAGAGATLLRSVAFFGGAGAAAPLWTLLAWGALGVVLVAVGRTPVGATSLIARARSRRPAATLPA